MAGHSTFMYHFLSFLVPGCDNVVLVGNSFCNDETNNMDCNYDGGDCCGYEIKTEECLECMCLHEETCVAGYHPLVGDGVCNSEINIAACNFDGNDCCSNPEMVGNGICNNQTNHADCDYDAGDCCGPDLSCKLYL